MAVNTDLSTLITKLSTVDAILVTADGFMTKYPRLFSPTARTEVITARSAMKAVIEELQTGTDLISELVESLRG